MTYPAESVQIGYQNHVEDVRSFLDSRHADHYTVFNLSQRNYRGAKFSNRVSAAQPPEATDGAITEGLRCSTEGVKMEEWLQMCLTASDHRLKRFYCHYPSFTAWFGITFPPSPYGEDGDEWTKYRLSSSPPFLSRLK